TKDGGPIIDLARRRQAIDLKAAAICEDWAAPAHEAVQAAHSCDEVRSGPQFKVIGVGKHDTGAGGRELVRCQALDGRLRADWHEYRRFDNAVRRMEPAAPRGAIGG